MAEVEVLDRRGLDRALLARQHLLDRRRVVGEGPPWAAMLAPGRFVHDLLVDGMLRATWWVERDGARRATLAVRPAGRLRAHEHEAVREEARRTLDVLAADAVVRDVRVEPEVRAPRGRP